MFVDFSFFNFFVFNSHSFSPLLLLPTCSFKPLFIFHSLCLFCPLFYTEWREKPLGVVRFPFFCGFPPSSFSGEEITNGFRFFFLPFVCTTFLSSSRVILFFLISLVWVCFCHYQVRVHGNGISSGFSFQLFFSFLERCWFFFSFLFSFSSPRSSKLLASMMRK